MLYRLIDNNGLFIEDVLLDTEPTDQHYIAEPCPDGFYWPRWDGAQWVEGGTPPEPIVTIEQLKQQLAQTDYRVIKCCEYQLAGLPLPYDIIALHTEKQALRDKINMLEIMS